MPILKISVLIPTLNRPDDLQRCLAAIKAQDRPADEVLVVIGPGDRMAKLIFDQASNGDVTWKCLNEQRPSVVCSLNTGIRAAQGDIIVLTDDDAAAPPPWLGLIEAHFLRDPKVGAIGGRDRLILPNEPWLAHPLPARNVGRYNWYGALQGNHHCGSQVSPLEAEVLKGVNLSFRRSAFSKIHIDDYLISHGAEVGWEIDICHTIKRAGWIIIYDNEVYVNHHVGPRVAGDERVNATSKKVARCVKNIAYLNAVYLGTVPMIAILGKTTLLGSQKEPGLIIGLFGIFRGKPDQLSRALKCIQAYLRGTWDGIRAKRHLSLSLKQVAA
jgi:glycosyltransferase involved in cell wall biosynthesis